MTIMINVFVVLIIPVQQSFDSMGMEHLRFVCLAGLVLKDRFAKRVMDHLAVTIRSLARTIIAPFLYRKTPGVRNIFLNSAFHRCNVPEKVNDKELCNIPLVSFRKG